MNALLDGARRRARRVVGRARRRLSGNDDGGFILLESIIAISLITVIMGAIGVEYVSGIAAVARQRATQSAAQIADSILEQVRALRPSDLVTGRGATSVATQFSKGTAISAIKPWLQDMDQATDSSAAASAGASATIPTCDPAPQGARGPAVCTQKPGTVPFTVSQFLGSCWLVASGDASNCVPVARKTTSSVQYLRVVVSVSWQSGSCIAGCYYVTQTLISADADPTFKTNQPPPAAPVIDGPGDQNNDIGDNVSLQLSLVTGTGIPGYTWSVVNGSLPTGLSMNPTTGVIAGTVAGPARVGSITVQLTDGFGRTDQTTLTWTVAPPPTIAAPVNQTTAINTTVNLQLTTTCSNTPCTYQLNNAPAGLTVSNTGLIAGAPSVPGTRTVSATVTDAAKRTVTSNAFTWTVLAAAPVCPTSVALANGSFESPVVTAGAGTNVANGATGLAWKTTGANGQIEYWANGGSSSSSNGGTTISAQSGTQWVEVNGGGMDSLDQDLATTPGQVLQWSLWHRARNATGNANAQDSIQVRMGTASNQTAQVPNGATTATISDDASAWVHYTGVYVVPAGQTTTRFQVVAISTSSGKAAVGNFLDNVTVTGAPCLVSPPVTQNSTVGRLISPLQLAASQGSGTYSWSIRTPLPAGLTLSSTGVISGTPTAVASSPVSLLLTDSLTSYQEVVSFTWVVLAAPTVTTPTAQTSVVGTGVNLRISATCQNTPCTYAMTGQPSGLTIDSKTGVITGVPTTTGTSASVTVTTTDNAGAAATTSGFSWVIKRASTITTPANQTTTVGSAVSRTLSSSCGWAPCTYALSGAPAGLSISTAGVITGTPNTTGTWGSATATITDAGGNMRSTNAFTWTVYARPTIISPGTQASTLKTGVIVPITSSCANAPCSYVLSRAPTGLSIDPSAGTIAGSPSATGTSSSVIVTMTDAGGVAVDTGTFAWTVHPQPSVTSPGNQSTVNNASVSVSLSESCSNSPCAYALNGGPADLSITSAGVITGRVTSAPRSFSGVTLTVTDAAGATATSAAFTWTVTTPLAGRWPMDESSGTTMIDATGHGHTATLSGSGYGRTSVAAQGANAVTLSGSGAASAAGSVVDTSGSFTVSAWVRLTSNTTTQTFVSEDGTAVSAFMLQYRQDLNRFVFSRYGSDSTTAAVKAATAVNAPTVGQWYHLTGVHDAAANTVALYVNGVKQASVAYSVGWKPAGTTNFVIGRGWTSAAAANWATAAIDDVRAYTSALSDDAVAQLSQALYWTLDDGTGTSANDRSLNNVDGTLSGATTWTTGIVGSGAAHLNASSGAITGSSSAIDTSQSFSISAWAKADAATATGSNTGTVASVDSTNVSGFRLVASGGKWTLARPASDSTSAGTTLAGATSSIKAGQWYHLAAVYDSVGKTLTLYVNGVQQGSPAAFSGANWKATGSFVVGRSKSGSSTSWFGGEVDDVQAFQFEMDQAGVTALTTLAPPAPATPTATAGFASATVSWTAPADVAGSPITGYVVTPYLDGAAQSAVPSNSTATTLTLSGLVRGGAYTFTVAAVNAKGTSVVSAQSVAVMPS